MVLICWLITIYMILLVLRAIMSWFPIRSGSPVSSVYSMIFDVTEPVLAPLRRIIPPAGMLDLSFLVLFIGLVILRGAIC